MAKITFHGLDRLIHELEDLEQNLNNERVLTVGEINLTKDADAMICVLYNAYQERRKNGEPKGEAKRFAGSPYIHKELMQKWSFEDVDETCRELSRAGLLACLFADNITYDATLSDAAIVYMENRFKDGVATFFEYLETIRALLPW